MGGGAGTYQPEHHAFQMQYQKDAPDPRNCSEGCEGVRREVGGPGVQSQATQAELPGAFQGCFYFRSRTTGSFARLMGIGGSRVTR